MMLKPRPSGLSVATHLVSIYGTVLLNNGDPEGRIFLSYPHMNNGFFFLLTTVFIFFIYFKTKLLEVPEYA